MTQSPVFFNNLNNPPKNKATASQAKNIYNSSNLLHHSKEKFAPKISAKIAHVKWP